MSEQSYFKIAGIDGIPAINGYSLKAWPVGYPITYLVETGGTLTGDTDIFIPGSTGVTLTTSYDTYYRFSGYEVTGGTIENNVLIPTGPCTAKAVYNVNYFTASGGFEKGSNASITKNGNAGGSTNVPAKYALHVGHTGDIPASWYETSNRWHPNNASAYSITLNPIMKFTVYKTSTGTDCYGKVTAVSLLGTTETQSQSFTYNGTSKNTNVALNYNKTFTVTDQDINYGISAKLYAHGKGGTTRDYYATTTYVATGTTGTWTATGIAP